MEAIDLSKTKLNLGCGFFPRSGYLNVDIHRHYPIDYVCDLSQFPWPFPDAHYDEVLMEHVLEHLPEIRPTLKEAARVLKPNGKLIIKVPHFSRGFTHWDHRRGFDVTFPYYFEEEASGGFHDIPFSPLSTQLVWFGQPDVKKKYLSFIQYQIGFFAGILLDWIGNRSLFFTSRLLCYWVGGYDEIKFVLTRLPSPPS
jgi:SAM-dependent methyltransferase